MKLYIYLIFLLFVMSNIVSAYSWEKYGPDFFKISNEENISVFSINKGNDMNDWWAGIRCKVSTDKPSFSFNLKTNKIIPLCIKLIDNKGTVAYINFVSPVILTKLTVDKNSVDYYENGSSFDNIEQIEIIFNGQWLNVYEDYVIEVSDPILSDKKIREPLPKLYNLNWMPKSFPVPCKGYEVESCIWNTWTQNSGWGAGNCEFTSYYDENGKKVTKNILDYYSDKYKYVAMDMPYIGIQDEVKGKAIVDYAKSKGFRVYAEIHHMLDPTFMTQVDGYNRNKYGQISTEVNYIAQEQGYDKTNPEVLKGVSEKMFGCGRVGVDAIRTVDYIWTAGGGPIWGYSNAAKKRIVEDLKGIDSKLQITEKGKDKDATFADYFKSYYGYEPKPEYCGLNSWDEYLPPTDETPAEYVAEYQRIFNLFYHYEWVKFVCDAVKPAYEKFGTKVQPICNPESFLNGTDIYWMLKQKRALGVCCEWWGDETCILGTYYNGPYYDKISQANKKDMCLFGETAAAGGSPFGGPLGRPHYYDNPANYLITYSQAGSVDFKSKQDQYIASTIEKISNPQDREYQTYTGFTSAYAGFIDSKNQKIKKSKTDLLLITNRPVCYDNNVFDKWCGAEDYSFSRYMFDMNYTYDGCAFPMEDTYNLNEYKTIIYNPIYAPMGTWDKMSKWLKNGKKTLITHSFVPTREIEPNKEYKDSELGNVNVKELFGEIKKTDITEGKIKVLNPKMKVLLEKYDNKNLLLNEGLITASKGKALIKIGDKSLVSEITVGTSKIIYINYVPLKTVRNSAHMETEELEVGIQNAEFEKDILNAVIMYAGYEPVAINDENNNINVLKYSTVDKDKNVFILLNRNSNDYAYLGENVYRVFQAQDPTAKGMCKINTGKAKTQWIVKDLLGMTEEKVYNSDDKGYIDYNIDGFNCIGLEISIKK